MLFSLWSALIQRGLAILQRVREQVRAWTKPVAQTAGVGVANDLLRSKAELILENALLRQQLTVLDRQVKRPAFSWKDRCLMVLLSSKLPSWRQALLIVQPDTLLRWHRELFKHF
jgi:putative transposase